MEIQNIKFLKILKKMKSSNFIYLGILIVFFIIVIVLFLFSTNFIIKNINKKFATEKVENIERIDIKTYSLIEKRFNLVTPTEPSI